MMHEFLDPTMQLHRMVTSSNENVFRVTVPLSKQSRRRWFEASSSSLWRHCNGMKRTECTIGASASDQHWTYPTVWNQRGAIFFQHNKGKQFLLRFWAGMGLLKPWTLFSQWRKKIILPKYQLYHMHHVNNCQVSLWLSCCDFSQIWTWSSISKMCLIISEKGEKLGGEFGLTIILYSYHWTDSSLTSNTIIFTFNVNKGFKYQLSVAGMC